MKIITRTGRDIPYVAIYWAADGQPITQIGQLPNKSWLDATTLKNLTVAPNCATFLRDDNIYMFSRADWDSLTELP